MAPQVPLLIVDNILIPHPLFTAMQNPTQNNLNTTDVAIGFMAEETDLKPLDILAGLNDKEFLSFIENKYVPRCGYFGSC